MDMASSYPAYRYPHAVTTTPASSSAPGGGRDDLAMLLAPLPALLPPRPPPHSAHHLVASPQSRARRRGSCTMAMLLGGGGADAGDRRHHVDTRCRYPSKLCRNARVRKASGALHRYCAYHRNKANANQKRWVDRQRHETTAAASPSSSSSSSSGGSPPASPGAQERAKFRWILAAASSSQAPAALSREHSAHCRAREGRREQDEGEDAGDGVRRASAATLGDDDWDALLSLLSPRGRRDE